MKRKFILLWTTFLAFSSYKAQQPVQVPIGMKSPQSYELERYGNIPVNLNVGQIDYNIPLFSTQIPGTNKTYTLDITYNSSGFIPAKKSNYVGLNWLLNYGGAITREVIGFPDDKYIKEPFQVAQDAAGYLIGARTLNLTSKDIYDNNYPKYLVGNVESGYGVKINNYNLAELEPDKFNFNFMGISGYFYIGYDLKPVIVGNDPNIQIDITGITAQSSTYCKPQDSQIIITDSEGNKYYFGGESNNLEISYNLGSFLASPPTQRSPSYYISGWYLTKVEFSSGSKIKIENKKYEDNPYSYTLNRDFCYNNSLPPTNSNSVNEPFFDINYYSNRINYDLNQSLTHPIHKGPKIQTTAYGAYYQMNLVKKVFPEKITIDDAAIVKFNYKEYPYYLPSGGYPTSLPSYYNYRSFKLDNIDIQKINQTSNKKFFFSFYRHKDYFFLDSLTENDKIYKFEYYKNSNLPNANTVGIDYWGYWNGKDEFMNTLLPDYAMDIDNTGNYTITGNSREPNSAFADVSLLKKVIYPTNGYTEFIYENHDYSQRIKRDASYQFYPYLAKENGIIGGARIKQMINYDGKTIKTTDYKYAKGNSNVSSGINSSYFRYATIGKLDESTSGAFWLIENLNSFTPNTYSSSPINYSEVKEYINSKLQKKYIFSDLRTVRDTMALRNDLRPQVGISGFGMPPAYLRENLPTEAVSNEYHRGKLLRTVFYNDNNDSIRIIDNKYSKYPTQFENKFVTRVNYDRIYKRFYKIPLLPSLLTSQTITDIKDGKLLVTKTNSYFSNPFPINLNKQEVNFPDNSSSSTTYQYAHEKGNQKLINANMIGIPLQTTTTKDGKVIANVETKYDDPANLLPTSVLSYDLQNPAVSKTELTYDLYDNKGNI
ncbi:hypothetical protein KRE47_17375, partial [Elizabethkingia meningoseptica]